MGRDRKTIARPEGARIQHIFGDEDGAKYQVSVALFPEGIEAGQSALAWLVNRRRKRIDIAAYFVLDITRLDEHPDYVPVHEVVADEHGLFCLSDEPKWIIRWHLKGVLEA